MIIKTLLMHIKLLASYINEAFKRIIKGSSLKHKQTPLSGRRLEKSDHATSLRLSLRFLLFPLPSPFFFLSSPLLLFLFSAAFFLTNGGFLAILIYFIFCLFFFLSDLLIYFLKRYQSYNSGE